MGNQLEVLTFHQCVFTSFPHKNHFTVCACGTVDLLSYFCHIVLKQMYALPVHITASDLHAHVFMPVISIKYIFELYHTQEESNTSLLVGVGYNEYGRAKQVIRSFYLYAKN